MYDWQIYFLPPPQCSWCSFARNVKNRFLYIEGDISVSVYSLWVKHNFQVLLFKLIQWKLNLYIVLKIFTDSVWDSEPGHSLCLLIERPPLSAFTQNLFYLSEIKLLLYSMWFWMLAWYSSLWNLSFRKSMEDRLKGFYSWIHEDKYTDLFPFCFSTAC